MIGKLYSTLRKVILWGPGGVINYLKAASHRNKLNRRILRSARGRPASRGITLIGNFTQFGSSNKVLRDLATNLCYANILYQTLDTTPNPSAILLKETKHVLTPTCDFQIDKYDHIVEILPSIVPAGIKIPKARIAFWEFESGFLYAYPDMPYEQHVIAMSDFNYDSFKTILPARVKLSKILYPFRYEDKGFTPADEVRRRYGIGANDFAVLFNFDFGAGFNRKNPDGAMRAFAQAFHSVPNAKLILKTKSAADHPDRVAQLKALAEELGIARQLVTIDAHISQLDVFGLTNACDAYLSLHRGEGFGITLAEAMAMGKPVVCSDWSSTTEFCKPDCTIPVPVKMVAVRPEQVDHPYYRQVKEWAEPDVDAAAAALRRLYDDPGFRAELGRKAAASIREQFSIENFRKSVEAFLDS